MQRDLSGVVFVLIVCTASGAKELLETPRAHAHVTGQSNVHFSANETMNNGYFSAVSLLGSNLIQGWKAHMLFFQLS